ncbi:MAG: choloylglycine hydrolase family protein [Syntrophaceae bacterium]|mgnify:FL=1|nr:choloylglycine hydrolase family protein [Syntrophaceae bacterium]
MKTRLPVLICAIAYLVLSINIDRATACMSFSVTAKDQTITIGRTMEFGVDSGWKIAVTPRNIPFTSPAPGGKDGLEWQNKYGYVSVVGWGIDTMVVDGLNEKGLCFGALWYELDVQWQEVKPGEEKRALAQTMMGPWLLGNFATVDEVKKAISEVKLFGYVVPALGMSPPGHAIIYDAQGKCIVLEVDEGRVHIYDNPLGILTNAPNFPWHVAHLRQFIGMSTENPKTLEVAGMKFVPTGHGAGMIGMPGDFTPPSRFIRLGMTVHFADKAENADKNLNLCQHIVDSFAITKGLVTGKMSDGKILKETTQWASFRDLGNKVFYFKTYDNPDLRKIDLMKLDFAGGKLKFIDMDEGSQTIKDVTGSAK